MLPEVTAILEQANRKGEVRLRDCRKTAAFGIYGEIGLLLTEGMDCSDAIADHWIRLLELER